MKTMYAPRPYYETDIAMEMCNQCIGYVLDKVNIISKETEYVDNEPKTSIYHVKFKCRNVMSSAEQFTMPEVKKVYENMDEGLKAVEALNNNIRYEIIAKFADDGERLAEYYKNIIERKQKIILANIDDDYVREL